jgi:putative restriction endonuclease
MSTAVDCDIPYRNAAFARLRELQAIRPYLTRDDLAPGFTVDGNRVPFWNPQRGIFKPRQMQYLLSIKTVFPRPGNRIWYDDQTKVHAQIFESFETVDYSFMGTNPDAADNRWLREAYEQRVPIIYFLGIAPGRYQAVFPTYIVGWHPERLCASVAFGAEEATGREVIESGPERRYGLRLVQQRLHQASFREAVITAYKGRCAISGLPEQRLLDAAHIIEDGHEALGQPVVPNGLPLSKLHHAAFDSHLIGIDPDYRLHVSEALLEQNDGPMLEALKQLGGTRIHLPRRERDRPDRDRLAARFEQYRASGA